MVTMIAKTAQTTWCWAAGSASPSGNTEWREPAHDLFPDRHGFACCNVAKRMIGVRVANNGVPIVSGGANRLEDPDRRERGNTLVMVAKQPQRGNAGSLQDRSGVKAGRPPEAQDEALHFSAIGNSAGSRAVTVAYRRWARREVRPMAPTDW